MRSIPRRVALIAPVVAVVALLGTTATAAEAAPAVAPAVAQALPSYCSAVGTSFWNGCIDATAGLNARSHTGAGAVTYNDPVIYTYPYGTLVHVYCYLSGPALTGVAGTTTIWDAIDTFQPPNGSTTTFGPGPLVVSTDAFVYTGTDNPVVRHC